MRAGGAFVEIVGRDKLGPLLDKLKARMNAFGSAVQGIGLKMIAAGSAIALPFLAAADHFRDVGDSLADMATRTGVSTEALSELGHAANLSGGSIEDVEAAILAMQKTLSKADEEAAFAAPAFEQLGLSMEELAALNPEKQFLTLLDAISKVEEPTTRAGLAMQVFRGQGKALLPLLADGAAGIEEMREEARKLGLSISGDSAAAAAEFDDAMVRLKSTLGAIAFEVGGAVAPALAGLLEGLKEGAASVRQFLSENKALVVVIAAGATALLAGGAALVALGVAAKVAAVGVGVLTGVVSALLSPLAAVAAALGGLGYLWVTSTESGKQFGREVGESFTDLKDTAVAAWAGIAHALQRGDMEAAFEVATAGLKTVWARLVRELTRLWNEFKGVVVDTFHDAVAGNKMMLAHFGSFVERNLGLEDPAVSRANRDAVTRRLMNERGQQQRASDAARRRDVEEAERDLAAARERLRRVVAEEMAQPLAGGPAAEGAPSAKIPSVAMMQKLASATRGMFSGSGSGAQFAQVLAAGSSVAEQQLKAQKDQVKKLDEVKQAVADLAKVWVFG